MTPAAPPTAVLVDLDGVLRRRDPATAAAVEARYGLTPGTLAGTARHWPRLLPAITGRVDHDAWLAETARVLSDGPAAVAPDDARAAVAAWAADPGEVDPAALAFVRELRAAGRPVALAANATARLDADLAALGLAGEVDAVVASSAVGAPMPAREFFAAACAALGLPPARIMLLAAEDRVVRGARVAGLRACRWTGPADLGYVRAALGLDPVRS